jgi:4-amino-4-deoxy-L-arabinose transferase-like glycosyltransferase
VDATPTGPLKPTRHDAAALLILGGLCAALFFFRLGGMALLNQDEGMHAVTAKEMVVTGDWLTPRFNGENFYDKPALFSWAVAASFVAFGFTEFAARLPAALLGLGTVLTTWWLGRRLFDRGTGLLAGVVLATSLEVVVLSRAVQHDIGLAFAQTLALALFYGAFTAPGGARRWWLAGFYAAMGLGVLAKGPIGALLPGVIVGAFLLLSRRWDVLKAAVLCPLGWLVFVVIAAPWYVAMSLRHDDYARYFFLEKNLGSFFGAGEPVHAEPIYYYVAVLFAGFLPWSCFLPLALLRAGGSPGRAERPALLYLMLWLGVIFVFFSLATSKLASYILPLMPAAALLTAWLWRDLLITPARDLRRGVIWSWFPLLALTLAGVVIVAARGLPPRLTDEIGATTAQVMVLAALLCGGNAVGVVLLLARRHGAAFGTLAGTVVAVTMVFTGWVGPSLESIRTNVVIARKIDRLLPPGEPIAVFPVIVGVADTALFYTDRPAVAVRERGMRRQLREDDVVYFVVKREDLRWLERFRDRWHVVDEAGNKVIISNRAALPPGT